jgi:hypothetical protein
MSTLETTTHREQAEIFSSQFMGAEEVAVLHGYLWGVEVSSVSGSRDITDVIYETRVVASYGPNPVSVVSSRSMDAFVVGAAAGIMADRKTVRKEAV